MEQAMSVFSGGLSSYFGNMTSSRGTSLQGGATALSMLSEITAGRLARNQGDASYGFNFYAADFARSEGVLASRQADLDAKSEELAGRTRATQLQEDLVQTISGQRVAFAASGSDGSYGTAARLAEQTERRGAQDLAIERSNTKIASIQALIRGATARRSASLEAAELEAEGRAARSKGSASEALGYLGAGEKAFNYAKDVAKRK